MRYIRNISDDQNKSGDTDNIFRFNLLQGSDIFNFGDYPISVNIANSSGYILSMVPEKEFGNSVVKLDFNDRSLKSLTPDDYLLEVEVKFSDGTTATFPTKGGMPFAVNSNLKNTAGHLVPTVTFDEVLDAVDEKVNNYLTTVVKGDKGDPGDSVLKSVAEFGAKGDGVTDDTAAIQAAIDAVHAEGGGEVHIPSGTYILSNSLTIYSYIKLIGSSQYAVTIKQTNVNAAHIYATDVIYPTIKDITFVGLGMDSAGGGGIFLTRQNNDNTEGVNFENVTVRNCAGSGITISCPITSVFTNVVCLGLVGSGFSFYGGGTSVVMNACYAITCTEAGFDFNQLNYSVLNACAVEVCGIGYYLHGNCNNISLIGCGSEDQIYRKPEYPGVDFQIEGGVGNSIISGYSRNNSEAGIRLFGGGKPVVISYRQIGTAKYSIVTDANVSGAIIQGESVSSPTSYVSGTVRNFADDSKVIHNTGTETIAGDKTLTGKTALTGGFTFNLTNLNSGTNADSITTSGSYSSNGTIASLPVTPAYGVLDVESNATDTKQIFTQTNVDRPVTWSRVKNNNIGGWSNWVLTFGYSDLNISEVANDPSLIDLSTDKTMYAPYEGVTFKGYPNANSGKVNIEYWKREKKVATQTVRFSSSEVTWKWYLPSDDNEQYIAKIVVTTEGGRTSTQYYAINVATNSNNLPIMGFLSSYTTYDPKAQRSVMNWLKRTHMNYIQYYDSYYRPENFLAVDDSAFREGIDTNNPQGIGVTGTAADYWTDLSRHAVRKDVLQKYVDIGQEYGMKNMLYIPWGNTSYVDTDHGITPEMLLFPTVADATAHNVNSVPATLIGGTGQWARYSLMKANPSSSAFKNMLFTSAKKALQSIGFDGLHIDTLGPNYGGVYTIDGAEYSNDFAASNGMPDFVNDAATFFNTDSWMKQGKNIRMSFNNVGSWGISALANNQNIDYLYAEQWPDMGNRTYNDMFNHVKDIVTSDTRGRAVIPAYIHKGYTGSGNFDDNGVIMLDLVIMAAGGTHLELGEHMLRSEYFPDVGLGLSDYLKDWLVQYYDFLVAYRRMFTSQNLTNTITSSSHAISVNSIDATKLSVVEKSDEFIQSLSLINTNGLNGSEWQDNQLNRNKPNALSNVNLKFNFTPKAVYYVTIENPIPQALAVTNNAVTVPSVDRYAMVYAYK